MAKTTRQPRTPQRETHKQSGGTFLGIVLGLIVGLGIAVVVALYITRAPTPFVAKALNGGDTAASASVAPPAGQFDPNRILQGKSPGLAVAPTTAAAPENTAPQPDAKATAPSGIFKEPQIVEVPSATPAAQAPAAAAPAQAPAQTSRTPAAPTAAVAPPVVNEANTGYFLQIGAYKTTQDAQQQRARLALQGFESTVTQRDSGGITYFRVRIGPFSKFDEMNNTRQQLSNAGIDSAVIRFTKQ
ncbi:SPOR domain-containing protein [Burkholderia sp. L27(2015)]|uniref:SPOR domain-containing protein n=1 Tax=Burkholderia sp. L27(2015) TaxID=1641858 RepID=UPI00131D50AF|nr:SPOR domain-containing protein [Burkholderia sp. L27(2015)]